MFLLAVAVFIYFEFFFLGVQTHQEYTRVNLTQEDAIKECPDVEVSENDKSWMILILNALREKNFVPGEYTAQELGIPLHPQYITEDTWIKVTYPRLSQQEPEEELLISAYFDDIGMHSGYKKISLNVDGAIDTLVEKEYEGLEYSKSVQNYLNSIFAKELPDTIYSFNNQEYGKLTLEHKWFALIRGFFTMK